jgi:hypothetical protein
MNAQRLSEAILSATRPEVAGKALILGRKLSAEHGARDCALAVARAMETEANAE